MGEINERKLVVQLATMLVLMLMLYLLFENRKID